MNTPKLSRRKFLKVAGVTGALTIPALAGLELLREAQGESLPDLSPYAQIEMLDGWPTDPKMASPILLLINKNASNPFGLYLAEILRAEGLNCFQIADVSDLDRAPLNWYDIILLAEGSLDQTQVELLESFVAKGGNLVAMRPDARLASLMGLEPATGSLAEGYLQVEGSHPIGQGIAAETLQFHGVADQYRLAGAQVIAWLASDITTKTNFPAVTVHHFGPGRAAAWSFDLARSIAYTRQGNPAWANQERDGGFGIRAADMFKDWVDLDRLALPQADEQQRLLANLLTTLSQTGRPLPRLWYFPRAAESVFIATGDAHMTPAYAIEESLARVEQRGGHMSIYYSPALHGDLRRLASKARYWASDLPLIGAILAQQFRSVTATQAASWRAQGHEFALHPYVGQEGICAAYMDSGEFATPTLEAAWEHYWQEFTGLGYGPVPPTARTHCVLWTGWVESARLQASCGIRLNLDYYHWGPTFRKETGEWVYGHFTGSGLPMKFVDEQGRILNIYQQLTQLADDHLLDARYAGQVWGGQAKLTAEAALEVSRVLIDRSLAAHCAIATNFHPDLFFVAPFAADEKSRADEAYLLEGVLDYVAEQGIPIWSAAEWLQFTEARHDASFEEIRWHPDAQRLSFKLTASPLPQSQLSIMIPEQYGQARLAQIEVDGATTNHFAKTVGGVNYAVVSVEAGDRQAVATYA
jgi:hypothetical protein